MRKTNQGLGFSTDFPPAKIVSNVETVAVMISTDYSRSIVLNITGTSKYVVFLRIREILLKEILIVVVHSTGTTETR